MPPRHAYWTIIVDDRPTAFRAHDAEELLPTLNRLREKNASAVMKWFERGQLFDSRDAARDAGLGRGERRWEGPRPERGMDDTRAARESGDRSSRSGDERPRDKNWRPGGTHSDPRQKYRDAKKAKWTRFKQKVRGSHDRRQDRAETPGAGFKPETFSPPHGDPLRSEIRDSRGPRPPRSDRPPRQDWSDRSGQPSRPHGDKMRSRPPRPEWRRDDGDRDQRTRGQNDRGDRDRDPRDRERPDRDRREDTRRDRDRDRPQWQGRDRDYGAKEPAARPAPRKPWGSQSGEPQRKPWGTKPTAGGRKPWGSKPAGGGRKPWGAKPAGAGREPGASRPAGSSRKPWGSKPAGRKPWAAKPPGRPAQKPWEAKRKRRKDEDE